MYLAEAPEAQGGNVTCSLEKWVDHALCRGSCLTYRELLELPDSRFPSPIPEPHLGRSQSLFSRPTLSQAPDRHPTSASPYSFLLHGGFSCPRHNKSPRLLLPSPFTTAPASSYPPPLSTAPASCYPPCPPQAPASALVSALHLPPSCVSIQPLHAHTVPATGQVPWSLAKSRPQLCTTCPSSLSVLTLIAS